jgi:uncharacterized protein
MAVTSDASRWGLGHAVAGFAVAVVASSALATVLLGMSGGDDLGNLGSLVAQCGLWAGLLGAPLVASHRHGQRSLRRDFGFTFELGDWRAGLVGAACQLLAFPLLYVVLQAVLGDLDVGRPARELAARATGWEFLVLALLVSLVAPVVEELFYRGLVLRAFERRSGSRAAVLGSSVWFGASHLQAVQFPALFLLGVVLALLTVRSGRLGPAIVAHVTFNAITMGLLAVTS